MEKVTVHVCVYLKGNNFINIQNTITYYNSVVCLAGIPLQNVRDPGRHLRQANNLLRYANMHRY